jgi:hypothetical protein
LQKARAQAREFLREFPFGGYMTIIERLWRLSSCFSVVTPR